MDTATLDMTKISALADKCRAFDREYDAIVVLQHATPEVRPCVVSVMEDYCDRMRVYEAELAALSHLEHATLHVMLGLPVRLHV